MQVLRVLRVGGALTDLSIRARQSEEKRSIE